MKKPGRMPGFFIVFLSFSLPDVAGVLADHGLPGLQPNAF